MKVIIINALNPRRKVIKTIIDATNPFSKRELKINTADGIIVNNHHISREEKPEIAGIVHSIEYSADNSVAPSIEHNNVDAEFEKKWNEDKDGRSPIEKFIERRDSEEF